MKKSIKKLSAVFLAVFVIFAMTMPAFAEEGEAIGNFAEGTAGSTAGQTQNQTETVSATGEQLISLSNGITYSADEGLFYFTVENSSFGINVPDGAIITGTVRASLSPSLTGVLYKNGEEQTDADLSNISAAGKYILAVTANDATQTVRVNFTIVTSPTSAVKEYKMPTDFFVVGATLNGETASYSQTYVDMSSDGDYVIDYRSPEADKDFQLAVTIDHTPPTVTLTGLTDGKANGPVTVSDMEEGARAYLVRNNSQITYTDNITETGSYTLTVQDEAGNETVYDFVVVTYANGSLKGLIATGVVLILALLGYFIYYRKYIRVS